VVILVQVYSYSVDSNKRKYRFILCFALILIGLILLYYFSLQNLLGLLGLALLCYISKKDFRSVLLFRISIILTGIWLIGIYFAFEQDKFSFMLILISLFAGLFLSGMTKIANTAHASSI